MNELPVLPPVLPMSVSSFDMTTKKGSKKELTLMVADRLAVGDEDVNSTIE